MWVDFEYIASLIWSSCSVLSIIPLCLDDFIVTLPYNLVTITNPFQLGLWPEATLSDAARGPNFFPELLVGGVYGCPFGIWTSEAVPSFWLETRVSCTLLWVSAWIWLVATLVSIIPTDLYHRVSIMIYGAPKASAVNLSSGYAAALTGLEDRLTSSGSGCLELCLATSWVGGVLHPLLMLPSSVPMQALLPLWPSSVLPGEQSCFFAWDQEQVSKCKEWLSNWSASCLNVLCRRNWSRSADSTC